MRCAAALILASALVWGAGPVTPGKKIVLFNGKDLSRFYVSLKDSKRDDPRQVFSVTNKVIRISGEEWGGLTTLDEYRDYRLIVEWKWGSKAWPPRAEKARDSGILIHGTGVDGAAGNGWLESIEYQMIEGGSGDLLLVKGAAKPRITVEAVTGADKQLYWQKGAPRVTRDAGRINWFGRDIAWKDQLGYRGPRDVEKPLGQWNRSEVIAHGGNLDYLLNGVLVNQGFDGDHTSGKIQFQSEGAEVLIRRIELHPLRKR